MLVSAPKGYAEVELCGTGATSRVFKARNLATGTTVALKRMHKQRGQTPEALARLKRELEASSRLSHPAIVPLLDVIRWDGDPTIVMRYIPGEDLKAKIARTGPLAFAECERIARVLFEVLAAA